MIPQTFQMSDIAGVGALVVLEALLSADNALVLAILVKHLPEGQRQKALLYGLGGAFAFRLAAILLASTILKQWWLQALGAAYLLYLPVKHFYTHAGEAQGKVFKGAGFWQTVIAVELTDIAFALDSVLAGIGFITEPGVGIKQDKIWVVYLGAVIGIVLLRFAAGVFVRVLDRFPTLNHVAYLIVGWVGVKLALHATEKAGEQFVLPFPTPHFTEAMFWGGLLTIALLGTIAAYRNQNPVAQLRSRASDGEDAQDLTAERPAAEPDARIQ